MDVRVTGKHPIAFGLVAVACFALHPLAHAQLAPFTLTLGETVTHDDNLLRAPAGSEQSDWLSDTRLRLEYSDTLGRNQATAWAAVDDSRYRHDAQLDNVGHQLGGEFDWNSIDRLSGKIGVDDNSSLYRSGSTGDQSFQGKSILHTQRVFTRAAIGSGTTPIGFEGGVEFSSSKNSASALSVNDASQWVGDLGVSYAESPDLRLSLLGRRTVGRYPNFVPAAYTFHRDDLILGSNWISGGFTSLQAQLAYSREDYSDASARHYWTGFVRGNWQATGHIQLSASWARDTTQNFMGGVLGQGTNAGSQGGTAQSTVTQQSLSLNNAADLTARWQPTSKIELAGSYRRIVRHYDNVPYATGVLNGSDASSLYQVGLSYQMSRSFKAGCSGTRSTHAPGELVTLSSAYVSNAYSCFAELSLH